MLSAGVLIWSKLPGWLQLFSRCPFKRLTGLPCPTCGSSRVFLALAHFDLATAFYMNPLVAAAALVPFAWLIILLVRLFAGRGQPPPRRGPIRLGPVWRYLLVAVIAINWLFLILTGR
ncbi:DUF2752 domain-containing protein [bacterium]|nr:DUF2752 domain-containing protein [candidate division CSSED10-310 bacterium]